MSQRVRTAALALIALAGTGAVASAATAPTTSWVQVSGATGSSYAQPSGVSALPDGTARVTGFFSGASVDFGDGTPRSSANGGNSYSAFTEGLGADGSVRWVRTSTGAGVSETSAASVSGSPDGTAVVGGYFQGPSVDLGDGTSRNSSRGGSDYSAFTEGLGADGSVRWVRTSTATGSSNTAVTGVSALSDGTAVASGHFQGASVDLGDGTPRSSANSGTSHSLFTEGLGADGSVRWVRTSNAAGASDTEPFGVSALPDGTSVVGGFFRGSSVDLGDGTLRSSANGGTDASMFTEGLGADGSVRWVRTSTATGGSSTQANAVGAFPDGTAVVSGLFAGAAVDLGDGTPRSSANSGNAMSAFTEGLGADGSVRWVRIATVTGNGNAAAYGVSAVPDGTAVASGYFLGASVDFGDGTPRSSANGGNSYSAFTEGLGADGSVRWVHASTATGSSDTEAFGVSTLPDGTALLTGYFRGTSVDFDGGTPRSSSSSGSLYSAFTQKFLAVPSAPAAPVAAAGDGSATASIAPIAGGSVTSYTVRASTGGGTCTIAVPSTRCTVTGLTNGTSYTFTATATNATGTSDASAPSAAVVPTGSASPSTPTNPAGVASLPGRAACTRAGVCTTSGTVPGGATRVVQIATRGNSRTTQMAFGAHATARVTTTCKITTTRSRRTYTCKARLSAGKWTLTTQAKAGATVIAQSVKHVTVRRVKRTAVTG